METSQSSNFTQSLSKIAQHQYPSGTIKAKGQIIWTVEAEVVDTKYLSRKEGESGADK